MTLFKDVIKSLTDGLDTLNTKTKAAVDQYNSDTTTFQNYVTSNITGVSGSIFLGQGAKQCLIAVGHNVSRAQCGTTKLADFQLACDQTKKELDSLCSSFDDQSLYYLAYPDPLMDSPDTAINDPWSTTIYNYSHTALGYSLRDRTEDRNFDHIIIDYIREYAFSELSPSYIPGGQYYDIDSLLVPGKGQGILEDYITQAVSSIQAQFQSFKTQRHSDIDELNKQGKFDGPFGTSSYPGYKEQIDNSYDAAIGYVNTIAQTMKSGYTEWVMEFQATVGQFQEDVITASDIKALTVGDLTNQITAGPYKNAKVIILQTPNGIVVIVKGGVDAATVEKDIQKYLQEHGLSSSTPITMFGYEGGGAAAQQVIEQGEYHVTNLILVGATVDPNLPGDINVTTYQKAPQQETKAQQALILGLKPGQILVPLAATTILFFATDGASALADFGTFAAKKALSIGTGYAVAEAWNAATNQWSSAHPNQQVLVPEPPATAGPQLYVDEGSGAHPMTRQEFFTIQQAALNHQPLPASWHFYLRQNTDVPAEPGSNLNSFTDSSYLDSQVIN